MNAVIVVAATIGAIVVLALLVIRQLCVIVRISMLVGMDLALGPSEDERKVGGSRRDALKTLGAVCNRLFWVLAMISKVSIYFVSYDLPA